MLRRLLHQYKRSDLVRFAQKIETLKCKKTGSKSELVDSLASLDIKDVTQILSAEEVLYCLSMLRVAPKKEPSENLAELNHILEKGETLDGEEAVFLDPAELKSQIKSLKTLFRSKDISLIKQGINLLDCLTPNVTTFKRYLEAFGYPLENKDLFDRAVLTEILFGKSIVRHYDQHSNVQYVGWWCLGKLVSFPAFQERVKDILQIDNQGAGWADLPETILNFREVKEILLANGTFLKFPEELFTFEKLEKLSLRSCRLKNIPKEIKSFKHLKHLCLDRNQLTKLPDEIGEMTTLMELFCCSNRLKELPDTIGQLSRLRKIKLRSNRLQAIPPTIVKLKRLRFLDISQNPIKYLPERIDKMKLTEFHFDRDQIESLPDEFALDDLYKAFRLDDFCSLVKLPRGLINICADVVAWKKYQEMVCELPNLKSLRVENKVFYRSLSRYGSIQNLHYFGQAVTPEKLTELTENIGKLKKLEVLDISNNQFKFLPETIGGLHALIKLSAENCNLVELPKMIKNLKHLEILKLSNNRLHELPEEIGDLESLKELYLSGNALTKIPESIQNLKNLSVLVLEDNALREIPDFIMRMRSLQVIRLADNPLSGQEQERLSKQNCSFELVLEKRK